MSNEMNNLFPKLNKQLTFFLDRMGKWQVKYTGR